MVIKNQSEVDRIRGIAHQLSEAWSKITDLELEQTRLVAHFLVAIEEIFGLSREEFKELLEEKRDHLVRESKNFNDEAALYETQVGGLGEGHPMWKLAHQKASQASSLTILLKRLSED